MDVTFELTGTGLDKPTTFTFEQLARMKMVRLDEVLMRKSHEDDEITSWQGPPLEALLDTAGIKSGPMNVTLVARDGYEVEATLEDMADAIVAMKDGQGRWLYELDEDCPLKLVPPHQPGNFWIMNPCQIKVEPAKDAGASR